MTANAFTAGRERYYRLGLARGDGAWGAEPPVSSSVPGVPPGVWHGQGAAALGLSGVVSDAQMRALVGLGMHPTPRRSPPATWPPAPHRSGP